MPGHVVKCGRVFYAQMPISHFRAVFSAFPGPGGTSYRPGRKSVLNRIFCKINFFCAKIIVKLLEIKIIVVPLYPG